MVENRGLDLFGLVYENYGICNLVGVGILSIYHNAQKLKFFLGLHLEITCFRPSNILAFQDESLNADRHLTITSNPFYL